MAAFAEYLQGLPPNVRPVMTALVQLVADYVPDAQEGTSYGLSAFTYGGRPLLGFGVNSAGLNVYPFDPRIVDEVRAMLSGYEIGKGVIRFTPEQPIPDDVLLLIVDLRLRYLTTGTHG